VAVEIAQRHVEDPAGWLTRPSRHLTTCYNKLGIEGSISVPIASIWSALLPRRETRSRSLSARFRARAGGPHCLVDRRP